DAFKRLNPLEIDRIRRRGEPKPEQFNNPAEFDSAKALYDLANALDRGPQPEFLLPGSLEDHLIEEYQPAPGSAGPGVRGEADHEEALHAALGAAHDIPDPREVAEDAAIQADRLANAQGATTFRFPLIEE